MKKDWKKRFGGYQRKLQPIRHVRCYIVLQQQQQQQDNNNYNYNNHE